MEPRELSSCATINHFTDTLSRVICLFTPDHCDLAIQKIAKEVLGSVGWRAISNIYT